MRLVMLGFPLRLVIVAHLFVPTTIIPQDPEADSLTRSPELTQFINIYIYIYLNHINYIYNYIYKITQIIK